MTFTVNVVDVDVVILKEEFQPEATNHFQDLPVLEECTVEQFQTARPEVRRPGVKRLEVQSSDDDKPLPKRTRIECLKTFAFATA